MFEVAAEAPRRGTSPAAGEALDDAPRGELAHRGGDVIGLARREAQLAEPRAAQANGIAGGLDLKLGEELQSSPAGGELRELELSVEVGPV